ncbi:MAG: hypothetical protein AB1938_20350 [Myxococcota bacterium]
MRGDDLRPPVERLSGNHYARAAIPVVADTTSASVRRAHQVFASSLPYAEAFARGVAALFGTEEPPPPVILQRLMRPNDAPRSAAQARALVQQRVTALRLLPPDGRGQWGGAPRTHWVFAVEADGAERFWVAVDRASGEARVGCLES